MTVQDESPSRSTDPGGDDNGGKPPPIELIPMQPETSADDEAAARADRQANRYPVPGWPAHLCPVCDYLLTGLTSRRCPECGTPFTIAEARRRAIEKSPSMRWLFRKAKIDRGLAAVGFLLLFAAVALPNLVAGGFPTSWSLVMTLPGKWLFLSILPQLVATWIIKMYWDANWYRLLLLAGGATMLVSLLLTF